MPIRLAPGVLVAFEGIDGAGKTTQARIVGDRLEALGFEVVRTKEPTNGPHGQRLRASASAGRMSPEDELAAFIADRREHVDGLIAPALARGAVVIVDRYYFSTVAYQGARGLDPDLLLAENEAFAPRPDLLVLLDVTPEVGTSRIRMRGDGDGNLFERVEDLRKAAAIFGRLEGAYIARLNGARATDVLTADILARLYFGPLFRGLCRKVPDLRECEPAHCVFRLAETCSYPAIGSLAPVGPEALAALGPRIAAHP